PTCIPPLVSPDVQHSTPTKLDPNHLNLAPNKRGQPEPLKSP
ncbi:hypothetical protein RRG08_000725, partial [Elysia crispata]